MGAISRTKGKVAERTVAAIISESGLSVDRHLDGRAQTGDMDFAGCRAEVRRRERLLIERWLAEHVADCPPHLTPILIARSSRRPWLVALELSDFLELVKEARA